MEESWKGYDFDELCRQKLMARVRLDMEKQYLARMAQDDASAIAAEKALIAQRLGIFAKWWNFGVRTYTVLKKIPKIFRNISNKS